MKNLYWILLLAAFAACSLFKNSSRQVEQDMAAVKRHSQIKQKVKLKRSYIQDLYC
jgi:hypothetical protein